MTWIGFEDGSTEVDMMRCLVDDGVGVDVGEGSEGGRRRRAQCQSSLSPLLDRQHTMATPPSQPVIDLNKPQQPPSKLVHTYVREHTHSTEPIR